MKLKGKRVAIMATDGFEQDELFSPKEALENAGAIVDIISNKREPIRGWKNGNWGNSIEVTKTISDADMRDYNSLVLPGGVMNPDTLRMDNNAISFVRDFFREGKPVAAICHAPQILVSADVLKDRKITSYPSVKSDVINAGANWVDEEVVVDKGLVTSRNPSDLPAFNAKLIEETREGIHEEMSMSI